MSKLKHSGVSIRDGAPGRGSGRYPLGSGERPRSANNSGYDPRMSVKRKGLHKAEYSNPPHEKLSELSRQDGSKSIEELRRLINNPETKNLPEDFNFSGGRSWNSQNCAAAFELLERGYDVTARSAQNGTPIGNVERFFKNATLENVNPESESEYYTEWVNWCKSYGRVKDKQSKFWQETKNYRERAAGLFYDALGNETLEKLRTKVKNQGEGARGIAVVGWYGDTDSYLDPDKRTTYFHAFNYKVENGKPRFYDSDSSYGLDGDYEEDLVEWMDPRDLYIMRTDDKELSGEITNAVYSRRR